MDIKNLLKEPLLDPREELVTKFSAFSDAGIGVKQYTNTTSEMTADRYASETMRMVAEVVKEVELQNLAINEVGIQLLEDTIHNVFKLVVVQNKNNLLLGGTISKKLVSTAGLKVYDYILTFNFMSNDEPPSDTFSPDRLETVAIINIPLNKTGGIDEFGDGVTFDQLFNVA